MSKKKQEVKTKQLSPEEQIDQLKQRIKLLQLLPGDFRDIPPGSQDWIDYQASVPESQEAMEKWLHGPIFCIGKELNQIEILRLQKTNPTITHCVIEPSTCTLQALVNIIENAEANGASFIYMKGFPGRVSRAVNQLASFFKLRIRAKDELVDDNGRPL